MVLYRDENFVKIYTLTHNIIIQVNLITVKNKYQAWNRAYFLSSLPFLPRLLPARFMSDSVQRESQKNPDISRQKLEGTVIINVIHKRSVKNGR